jgi:hypothetical protein
LAKVADVSIGRDNICPASQSQNGQSACESAGGQQWLEDATWTAKPCSDFVALNDQMWQIVNTETFVSQLSNMGMTLETYWEIGIQTPQMVAIGSQCCDGYVYEAPAPAPAPTQPPFCPEAHPLLSGATTAATAPSYFQCFDDTYGCCSDCGAGANAPGDCTTEPCLAKVADESIGRDNICPASQSQNGQTACESAGGQQWLEDATWTAKPCSDFVTLNDQMWQMVNTETFVSQLGAAGMTLETWFQLGVQTPQMVAIGSQCCDGYVYDPNPNPAAAGGSCTASPASLELGAEVTLTLTYDAEVNFGDWIVQDANGNAVNVLKPNGESTSEMAEAEGTARPGTVMPMREAYVFPAAGVYSIIGGGVGVACQVTVVEPGAATFGACDVGANGQACQNGGAATGDEGSCSCDCSGATGFEGANCETATVVACDAGANGPLVPPPIWSTIYCYGSLEFQFYHTKRWFSTLVPSPIWSTIYYDRSLVVPILTD